MDLSKGRWAFVTDSQNNIFQIKQLYENEFKTLFIDEKILVLLVADTLFFYNLSNGHHPQLMKKICLSTMLVKYDIKSRVEGFNKCQMCLTRLQQKLGDHDSQYHITLVLFGGNIVQLFQSFISIDCTCIILPFSHDVKITSMKTVSINLNGIAESGTNVFKYDPNQSRQDRIAAMRAQTQSREHVTRKLFGCGYCKQCIYDIYNNKYIIAVDIRFKEDKTNNDNSSYNNTYNYNGYKYGGGINSSRSNNVKTYNHTCEFIICNLNKGTIKSIKKSLIGKDAIAKFYNNNNPYKRYTVPRIDIFSLLLKKNYLVLFTQYYWFSIKLNQLIENYDGYGFSNERERNISWTIERVIWIGYLKNINDDGNEKSSKCLFPMIGKDTIKLILSFVIHKYPVKCH